MEGAPSASGTEEAKRVVCGEFLFYSRATGSHGMSLMVRVVFQEELWVQCGGCSRNPELGRNREAGSEGASKKHTKGN